MSRKTFLFLLLSSFIYVLMIVDKISPSLIRPKSVSDFSVKSSVETTAEYYKRIGKTDLQIRFDDFTNVGECINRFTPIVASIIAKRPEIYIIYAGANVFQVPVAMILRKIAKEPRPDDENNKTSFPSGHSMFSFCGAIAMLFCFRYGKQKIVGLLFLIIAICVAIGRVLANRHYPIDVICGGLLGIFSFYLSNYCFIKFNNYFNIIKK